MPMTVIDPMNDSTPWRALAPDGVTPSTQIALKIDATVVPPGPGSSSALITATGAALNNTLLRTLGPIDLTGFDDIRFWIYSDVPADGTASRPFFLELRFASAAMTLTDPANTWQRYVPVSRTGSWETVRMTIADLPAAVRNGVTTFQLRCAEPGAAFNCHLAEIIAVQEAMIGDVDAALQAGLNNTISLGAGAVPAVLHLTNTVPSLSPPYFEILHFDTIYSRDRTDSAPARIDFTNQGYSLAPPSNAFDLYYQVTALAKDRATQAAMLEFVLRTLPPRGMLLVNGAPLPFEAIYVQPINRLGGSRNDQIPLFYRISARQQSGRATRVTTPRTVSVETFQTGRAAQLN